MAGNHLTGRGNCFIDRTGRRYGKLLVLEYAFTKKKRAYWKCRCDCGAVIFKMGNCLTNGGKACRLGCWVTKHGHTANGHPSAEYRCWQEMKGRCYYPKNAEHNRYGGRGIVVCDRWKDSFSTFLADMGPKPKGRYEIDRIDNEGNYEPGNCRWTTRHWQARNRSDNRFYTFQGETLCVRDWSYRVGVGFGAMTKRFRFWTLEDAILTPPHPRTRKHRVMD